MIRAIYNYDFNGLDDTAKSIVSSAKNGTTFMVFDLSIYF